jgi:hypothetical protein
MNHRAKYHQLLRTHKKYHAGHRSATYDSVFFAIKTQMDNHERSLIAKIAIPPAAGHVD